jgi:hypothetical protein
MLNAMAGGNGAAVPASLANLIPGLSGPFPSASYGQVDSGEALLVAIILLLIAWAAPNTQDITMYAGPDGVYGPGNNDEKKKPFVPWLASPRWAVAGGCLLGVTLISMSRVSEFIYFQF